MRRQTAETLRSCIETDLVSIEKFIELSEYWATHFDPEQSDDTESKALRALEIIRQINSTSKLLNFETKESVSKRCDELDKRLVNAHRKRSQAAG